MNRYTLEIKSLNIELYLYVLCMEIKLQLLETLKSEQERYFISKH